MRDITERLRSGFGGLVPPVCDEAANEIERLRNALEQIAGAFYSAPEVLRGMASTALTKVPNA